MTQQDTETEASGHKSVQRKQTKQEQRAYKRRHLLHHKASKQHSGPQHPAKRIKATTHRLHCHGTKQGLKLLCESRVVLIDQSIRSEKKKRLNPIKGSYSGYAGMSLVQFPRSWGGGRGHF